MQTKTLVIGDTQLAHGVSTTHIEAAGQYIVEERPDEIVVIGDWFDLESLSRYASNEEKEGRRLKLDMDAGVLAMKLLLAPLKHLQAIARRDKKKLYRPKLVFTMGNHEVRLSRFLSEHPHLIGSLPDINKMLNEFGFEVYEFLEPYIGYGNLHYFHYLANPMTGNSIGGSIDNKLNKVTYSFVMGHQQHFQYGERQQATGKPQIGIVVGAFYMHDEAYKGFQGNTHSRGTVVIHQGESYTDVEYISCERLINKYLK